MTPAFEQPTCLAIVLCHGVTKNSPGIFTLHGVFAGLLHDRAPMVLESLGVYAVFTNVRSRAHVTSRLTYEPAGGLDPVVLAEPVVAEIVAVSPLQRTPWAVNIGNVTLPGYGDYSFTLSVGGRVIGEQRFALSKEGRA